MTTRSVVTDRIPVSAGDIKGQLRRAQSRVTRAFEGDKPDDILVQATVSAVAAALVLRALRAPVIGDLFVRWAPLAAFAAMYHRSSKR